MSELSDYTVDVTITMSALSQEHALGVVGIFLALAKSQGQITDYEVPTVLPEHGVLLDLVPSAEPAEVRLAYQIELTKEEVSAIDWVGGRYDWSDKFTEYGVLLTNNDDGSQLWGFTEGNAHAWREACEAEDSMFACAAPELAVKLCNFQGKFV